MTVSHEHAMAVDLRLGELHDALWAANETLRTRRDSVHWKLGERPQYLSRHERTWPTDDAEAERQLRAKLDDPELPPYRRTEVLSILGSLAIVRDGIARLQRAIAPLADEYAADPWPRFFLVTNAGGHVHRNRSCSTCHPTTRYAWLPQLSGLTEADAVADQGPRLCSVCFPSAPVEWTLGLPKAAKCPGSGRVAERIGRSRYGACPVCGDSYALSNVGAIRAHKPKES